MNKSKILKLFGTVSAATTLAATGSILLTSCSNTNTNNNFTEGLTKTLDIRNLSTEQVPCPVYATPTQYASLMAPDFKAINEKNNTQLDEKVVIGEDGWPTKETLSEMRYDQFFMNEEVAKAMSHDGNAGSKIDLKLFISSFSDTTKKNGALNLKGLYKNDQYADETLKAFNCPYFYDAVEVTAGNYASVYSDVKTIDLSENNLWYLPFFGYDALGSSPTNKYIMKRQIPESGTPTKIGFQKLGDGVTGTVINLQDNQITLLPFADNVDTGEIDPESGEEKYENYDLTDLFNNTQKDAIAIDNNCIGYDLKNTSILSSITNYRKYKNMDTIAFHKDENDYGYQSYAVFTQREEMFDAIIKKCCDKLSEKKEDFVKRSLDSHVDAIQELSKVMNGSETKYPLGDCLNQILAEFLSDNGLISAYIYTKYEIDLTLLVQLFSNSDFIYDYPSFSSNNGCLTFSLQLGTPRICHKETNDKGEAKYVNKYATGQGSYFIAFSVYGFEATHIMAIIVGIIIGIVALALIFVIIYYAWLRKYIAKKRQLKDLEAIANVKKETVNKGGK